MKKKSKPIVVRRRRADADKPVKPITTELSRKLREYAALELGYLVLNGTYMLAERLDTTPSHIVIPDTEEGADELVAAAVRVAEQRTAWLRRLRTAIEASDTEQTLLLAEMLCGLREEDSHEAGDPASSRLN